MGVAEDVVERATLHDLAVVDDDHFLGNVGDDAEIVDDDQQGHAQFGLQVLDQLEDLGLDGDVERRARFVGDQQRGAAYQGHGNHRPLPQAAGQLERIGVVRPDGIGKADHPQHVDG